MMNSAQRYHAIIRRNLVATIGLVVSALLGSPFASADDFGWRITNNGQLFDASTVVSASASDACADFVAYVNADPKWSSRSNVQTSFAAPGECNYQLDIVTLDPLTGLDTASRYRFGTSGYTAEVLYCTGGACTFIQSAATAYNNVNSNVALQITGAGDPCKNLNTCPAAGNPVAIGSGNKHQLEVDFPGIEVGNGQDVQLRFARSYNSERATRTGKLGKQWRHSFEGGLVFYPTSGSGATEVTVVRPSGAWIIFRKVGSDWLNDGDSAASLSRVSPNWIFKDENKTEETYNSSGLLTKIVSRAGFITTLRYNVDADTSTLDEVEDHFGRKLGFTYTTASPKLIDKLTLPDATQIDFDYKDNANENMLEKVKYPAPGGTTVTRTYHYGENGASLRELTGITDENNARFATWNYDQYGRVTLSKHAGDAGKVTFEYLSNGDVATDTYVGASQFQENTYHFSTMFGVRLPTTIDGGPCPGCGDVAAATTYDANANVASRTDNSGNVSFHKHGPVRNEICKIEGITSTGDFTAARRTLTVWDEAQRLPTEVSIYQPSSSMTVAPGDCSDTNPSSTSWKLRRKVSFAYLNGQVKTRTERGYSLNTSGTPVEEANSPRVTTYTYYGESGTDPAALNRLLKSIDGPRTDVGDVTTYEYALTTTGAHQVGDLIKMTNALGQATEVTAHNGNGQPLTTQDPNGTVTTLSYHPCGWLLSKLVDSQTTAFAYDNIGQIDRVTQPGGAYLDFDYDAAHRLTDVRLKNSANALSGWIHYDLDLSGNRIGEQTKNAGGTLRRDIDRVYNALNQLEQSIGGAGQSTRFTYDANGNVKRIIDPRDPAPSTPTIYAENAYDALNRVRQVRDRGAGLTTATYDVFGNPVSMTDAEALTTSYAYNGFGERTKQVSPDTGTTSYATDKAGNVVSKDDARPSAATTYQYDALNRLTLVDYPTDTDAQFFYDEAAGGVGAIGNLTRIVDESGTIKYSYDRRGNVTQKQAVIDGITYTTGYTYDGADRLLTVTYPSGRLIAYVRNSFGQIQQMTTTPPGGSAQTLVNNVVQEPFGPVKSWTFGNGKTMNRTYDLDYRLTNLTHSGLTSQAYTYDADDNVKSTTDTIYTKLNKTYDYDWMSRLTQEVRLASGSTTQLTYDYEYDDVGNFVSRNYNGYSCALTYSAGTHRLSHHNCYDTSGIGFDQAYDAAGNTVVDQSLDIPEVRRNAEMSYGDNARHSSTTYTYIDIVLDVVLGQLTAQFKHNALGEATSEITNGIAPAYNVRYHYDEQHRLIAVSNSSGAILEEYFYLEESPVAFWVGTPTLYYMHTDHLDTPIVVSTAAGALSGRAIGPNSFWSKASQWDGGMKPRLRYAGQFIGWMGIVTHNLHREYSPSLGRYLQSDPIGLVGGINTYAYADNNPLTMVDPKGLAGIALGYSVNAAAPLLGANASGMVAFGNDQGYVSATAWHSEQVTSTSFGASAGRGLTGAVFACDISEMRNGSSFNLDTPFGGLGLLFDSNGKFTGLSLSGPSLGYSISGYGPDISYGH